jgi:hypothetical protein
MPNAPNSAIDQVDQPTRRYVDAVNSRNLDGLVAAFAPDAVLVDVNREFSGSDAIRGWAIREVIGGRLDVLEVRPYEPGTRMIVRFTPGGAGGFEACYTFDTSERHITRANLQYECLE